MRPRARPKAPCPCGAGARYEACCAPLHDGKLAATPEALMRSRYSAYALHKARYILDTTHPDGPHYRRDGEAWRREVLDFCKRTRFEGLEVVSADAEGSVGRVLFVASLRQDGRAVPLREHSEFRRVDGGWAYFAALEDT